MYILGGLKDLARTKIDLSEVGRAYTTMSNSGGGQSENWNDIEPARI